MIVPSCYPNSARSAHLHGFGGLGIHPYGHLLHQKVLKQILVIHDGSVIKSDVVPGLNHVHVVVVCFVPSCSPYSAGSIHLHGFDGLGIHPYNYPLQWKVCKQFKFISWKCNPVWSGSWPQPCQRMVWFVPSCYPVDATIYTHLHGFDGYINMGIHIIRSLKNT